MAIGASRSSKKQLRPGDRARVITGLLSGLTGLVSKQYDKDTLLIAVCGLEGIYIRVNTAMLERLGMHGELNHGSLVY